MLHFRAQYEDVVMYEALAHWLYNGYWPNDGVIRNWNIGSRKLLHDWADGDEKEPLSIGLAIGLYLSSWGLNWWGVVDLLMTFIFEQYQTQRITPSPGRVTQVYHVEHDSPLREFFIELHYHL